LSGRRGRCWREREREEARGSLAGSGEERRRRDLVGSESGLGSNGYWQRREGSRLGSSKRREGSRSGRCCPVVDDGARSIAAEGAARSEQRTRGEECGRMTMTRDRRGLPMSSTAAAVAPPADRQPRTETSNHPTPLLLLASSRPRSSQSSSRPHRLLLHRRRTKTSPSYRARGPSGADDLCP
jgi:hypothetical protein